MCKDSIDQTIETFSLSLKDKIKGKEELYDHHSNDLLDLAYSELVRINATLKNSNNNHEELLQQALDLASICCIIIDQNKNK